MIITTHLNKHVIVPLSLILALASGCATIQDTLKLRKPTASLQGLKFDQITTDSATLLFDVQIENPYPAPLPLVNVDYNLTSRDKPLLAGQADLQSTIPAHGKETISLPAKISYLDLVQAFKGVKPGSVIPYTADLGLSVDTPAVGRLRLPMKKKDQLSVPAIPNISDVDLKKLLLDRIKTP